MIDNSSSKGCPEPGAGARVAVLLPLPLAGPYDYRAPAGERLAPGLVVRVPLGRREVIGVVWEAPANADAPAVGDAALRPVLAVLETPPVPEPLRRLVDWVAAYTVQPPGAVLRLVLSVPDALMPPRSARGWSRAARDGGAPPARLNEGRARVLAALDEAAAHGQPALVTADLAARAGVTAAVITAMGKAGLIAARGMDGDPAPGPGPDPAHPGPVLSPAQAGVAAELRARVGAGFSVCVLHGVTGSGKTEVYFEAVAETLRQGRQAVILLPEIALATQWPERFQARFGARPLTWHSQVPDGQRRRGWRGVAQGRVPVVVGARSALFLPFPALGLIIVDEEHDASYKQDDGVPYHARDMAVVRARLEGVPVILASATPALETLENARRGRYHLLRLPARHGGAVLPAVTLVDLRAHPPQRWQAGGEDAPFQTGWIAPPLVSAIRDTLAAGEQVLLYLNRRGYAPLTLCRHCGHRLACPNCSAWLVEHRASGRLCCHHCGHQRPIPTTCPACGAEDSLVACGPGVERLAEEVAHRFPKARALMATSDTLGGPKEAAEMIRRVGAGEVDVLIGTQIMAKGHHFPGLTLVGVIDGDLGLAGGDPRAAERTHQLLHQVAGRAGRAGRPGRVLIQTADPGHPVMEALASGDDAVFLETEAAEREAHGLPPFGRLVALIVSGEDPGATQATARALARCAPEGAGVRVLGPAPAPLSLLRGRHRVRLLLKAPRAVRVQPLVGSWLDQVPVPRGVKVQVDVDPVSFL
ncbi:primosomal protein N' [Pararhodospirillum oryzae]|uniref:Replication restart protein PriA n=1 Tax=Pararhodospirillum oryzae TaxID=478448 RepID=A0A512H9V1_9PROT|nr:primosomal protein N' [Pararhodospirillum oryzae]GEO82236.1 primosomal protein N' [Pararhodospirillum oryzae]